MSAELSIAIKFSAALGGTVSALRTILGGTRDIGATTQVLRREYRSLGQTIREFSAAGGADLQRLQRRQQVLGQNLHNMRLQTIKQAGFATRLENGRAAREQMKSEVIGAAAGIGAVLVPIKASMDFESSMADVRKVVDFDTPQQFKEIEQQLLNMTHRIPMAASELSKIAASGGQLGIARQDIAGFTETIAKMATAFDMSAEEAGDSMAKLANVYKIPIKQINVLGDAINHLSNSSPARASDIVETLGRVGGVAKQFGLTELQTASLTNALISLGKTPEVAGTAINGMLTKLLTAEKGGNKFQAALKSIGISSKQLKQDIAQNGEQALMDFLKAINKLPKSQQMGILVDLFGLEYADDVAILSGSLETYQKSIDALQSKGKDGKLAFLGSMNKEFLARSATTANNVQLFKSQMQHLAISVGSVMLPAINSLLNEIKPLIESFIRFTEAHPVLIKNIFLALAGLVAFKAGGLAVRFMLSGLGSVFWKISSIVSGFFSLWARGSALIHLFKMGRAISALRMLGLTARQAKTWLSAFSAIGSVFSGSLRLIGTAFSWIINAGRVLIGFLPMIGQAFMALGRFLLMTPIGLALGLMATAAYLLYTRWDAVVGGAKLLWQDLGHFFSQLWLNIQMFFSSGLSNIALMILNWSPVSAFQAAFAAVSGFFSGLAATFMSYGGMLIDGLVNGIKAKIGNAVAAVQGLAARVKGAFTGSGKGMDIHSPSRVFRSYGGFITEGLAIGVGKGVDKPISKIRQLAGSLKTSFEASFSGAKNRFAEKMGGFRSDLSARLSANADNLSQARAEYSQAQINNGGSMTIHFNPTINAAGGNPQQIETALQMGLREFEDFFKRMMADQQRRAY